MSSSRFRKWFALRRSVVVTPDSFNLVACISAALLGGAVVVPILMVVRRMVYSFFLLHCVANSVGMPRSFHASPCQVFSHRQRNPESMTMRFPMVKFPAPLQQMMASVMSEARDQPYLQTLLVCCLIVARTAVPTFMRMRIGEA